MRIGHYSWRQHVVPIPDYSLEISIVWYSQVCYWECYKSTVLQCLDIAGLNRAGHLMYREVTALMIVWEGKIAAEIEFWCHLTMSNTSVYLSAKTGHEPCALTYMYVRILLIIWYTCCCYVCQYTEHAHDSCPDSQHDISTAQNPSWTWRLLVGN